MPIYGKYTDMYYNSLMQKKRQRYAVVPRGEVAAMVAEPYVRDDALAAYSDKPGKTGITITEMQRRGS